MLKLHRLYSEPKFFEEITFENGLNLILGETDDSSEKTNGVGKSLAIEFINYCLLKQFSDSRVSKIPSELFPNQALICLDFTINESRINIKRDVKDGNSIDMMINSQSMTFDGTESVKLHLTKLLFGSSTTENSPSFRQIMGILIRDERSEFKSIINGFDTSKRIPFDYTPHLYLLGINPKHYKEAKDFYTEKEAKQKLCRNIKNDVEKLTNKSFKDVNSELNELIGQVEQIQKEMDNLENIESFDIIKEEIINLEIQLEENRSKTGSIKLELSKIKLFIGDNYIDDIEIAELYESFREGLGNLIQKELNEVMSFKKKIDSFQQTLLDTRKKSLDDELINLRTKIKTLDKKYKEYLEILDEDGVLKNLKMTVAIYEKKVEEKSRLSTFVNKYDEYQQDIKEITHNRQTSILSLESTANDVKSKKEDFEKRILDIHNYIMGNKKCSFNIQFSEKKDIVEYSLRIHDDGSHSNEREKVFIYDIALLLTKSLEKLHPSLLIHDNIFDVDQDTLVKSLNYLSENEDILSTKQYILTLNRDKLRDEDIQKLKINLEDYTRASFSKSKRFLGQHYQEK